jgi:hypothetical protein
MWYNNIWWQENHVEANISQNFMVEGLTEQIKQLDHLLATNPEMEAKMRRVISKVLIKAQSKMRKDVGTDLPNDPRNAAKAVRKAVYRQILGGNINILRKRRATEGSSSYTPTRTLKSGQRGGNRRLRSERTMRMEAYNASDRGFILYWLNSGTKGRTMGKYQSDPHRGNVKRGSQGGDVSKYGKTVNTGLRGSISARNIFSKHLIELSDFIDMNLTKEFGDLIQKSL